MSSWKFFHIDRALIRPAPNSIPLSAPRCLENDFFGIYIIIKELDWKFLCRSKEPNGYSGFLWVGNENGTDATILTETLRELDFTVEITHYYKCYEFKYEKKLSFLLGIYTQRHKIQVAKDKLLQGVYNRKTLVRSERIDILNYLVEKTIEEPSYTTDPMYLGLHLHSKRWFLHPKRTEHQAHYRLLLDSLVETGEIQVNSRRYSVTGKALATLSEYEQDQQRHQDNYNNAKITHRLTLVLIFIALVAIGARLFMWWSDKQ